MMTFKSLALVLALSPMLLASPLYASSPPAAHQQGAGSAQTQTAPPHPNQEQESNRLKAAEARKTIVAKVNGAEITMFDLLGMMNRVANAFYRGQTPDAALTKEIKKRALDRLIFEELAIKEAEKQGIKANEEKTSEVISNLKTSYGEAGYKNYLADIAMNEEQLRSRIGRGQMLEGITGREVYQKQGKDPEALEKLYKEYKEAGKLKLRDEYHIREIFVMAGADRQATKASAEQLLADLKANNNNFSKLVLDGTFIVRTIRVDGKKYPNIFAAMLGMKIGELSGVVEDGDTFHIFEVLQKDPARDMTEEEAHNMLEDKLAVYLQEKRRNEWMAELRKDAAIEILLDELKEDK